MAAVNFPSSPATNDIFTSGGISWKWNGSTWVAQSATTLSGYGITDAASLSTNTFSGTQSAPSFYTSATPSSGLGLWNSAPTTYGIYLAPYSDSNAGRLDATSDYNIYYKIGSGANRGHVFKGNSGAVVQITGGGQIYISPTSSGTAPFVLSANATAVVSNLNADKLDGLDSTAFALVGSGNSLTGNQTTTGYFRSSATGEAFGITAGTTTSDSFMSMRNSSGNERWRFGIDGDGTSNIRIERFNSSGVYVDTPFLVSATDGSNDFVLKNGAWYNSADAVGRLYFTASGANYYKSGNGTHEFRNAADAVKFTIDTSGNVTMAGKLSTIASTTSAAGINIPHGTAPTSPTNGDLWTTTSGALVQINSATKTIAFTDSSITGSAATLTTGRTIAITGDLTWTSPSFNGSGNVTAAGTLATVNSNVGSFGSTSAVPIITVNAKGLITAVSTGALGTSATVNTGTSGATIPLLNGTNTWSGTQTLVAGTTTVAPLKFQAGVNLTTPVAHAMEWDGTNLSVTQSTGPTRKTVAYTDSNITGSAATLTTGRTIAITGDLTWTSPSFNGSGNVTAAGTLATVNSNVGAFGSTSAVPIITVNAKGLITAVSTAALGTAAVQNTGTSGANIPFLNGTNTWSGKQTTLASAVGTAGFNIPHGTAPTTPTNGDIWTTTSGLLAQINSATKTVAFTDSNITGSAATLTTGRTIAITGDLAYTSGSFNGSGNVTGTGTLATVNSNVGSFGSTSAVPIITVNAKGLITAVSTAALGTAAVQNTGTSGATIPFLNGTNTWAAAQTFSTSASSPLFSGGAGFSSIAMVGANMTFDLGANTNNADSFVFANRSLTTITSGIGRWIRSTMSFAPTSGTAEFRHLSLEPTLNQTGGANGAMTVFHTNVTQTAVVGSPYFAKWQLAGTDKFTVDTSGNTNGNSFTATSYLLGGNVYAGVSSLLGWQSSTNLTNPANGTLKINTSASALGTLLTGGIQANVVSKSANYTLTITDNVVLCDTTSAGFTITLPTAVGATGQIYYIKKIASANTLTLATTSAQTIDGSAASTYNMTGIYDFIGLQSDGANWVIVTRRLRDDTYNSISTVAVSASSYFLGGNMYAGGGGIIGWQSSTNLTNPDNGTLKINTSASALGRLQTGGVQVNVAAKTANYTATTTDYLITCDAASGSFTITLPTAVGATGQTYIIKKITAANTITMATTSSQTIDGAAAGGFTLVSQWDTLEVVSNGANWIRVDRSTAAMKVGTQTLPVNAAAMTPRLTNGAAAGNSETTTNKVMITVLDFDQTTAEYAQFMVPMPKSWNEGTVTAQFYWTATTTGNVVWGIQGLARSDDDALDTAFGTAVTVTDGVTAANDLMISSVTSAMTIGGTPAENDLVFFQVYRDAASGSDTLAADARLLSVKIFVTYNLGDDS